MGFMLAHAGHDAQLRRLLRKMDMPGSIRLAFCRDPDYFLGQSIYGPVSQTLVYEVEGGLGAMACRSVKPVFVNGRVTRIGYLHGLRIVPELRNGMVLGRGYRAIRELHADGLTPAYLTTIVRANQQAQHILTSKKGGIPEYREIGTYRVSTLVKRRPTSCNGKKIDIIPGAQVNGKEIVTFLQENGRCRQFFPFLQEGDFNTPYTRDFSQKDFLVAVKGSKIRGTLGLWDQNSFKQNVVTGYSGVFSAMLPLVNAALRLAGNPPLPVPGENFRGIIASFICIEDDDPGIIDALLASAVREIRAKGFLGLSIGFHESDRLQQAVKKYFCLSYASRIYLVHWEDGRQFSEQCCNSRIPYLELGTL